VHLLIATCKTRHVVGSAFVETVDLE